MPLDLVGRLHRTVHVAGCPEYLHEDVATFFLKRCGAIEAWESSTAPTGNDEEEASASASGPELTLCFERVDSISTAVSLHGMTFGGPDNVLCVWVANRGRAEAGTRTEFKRDGTTGTAAAASSNSANGGGGVLAITSSKNVTSAAASGPPAAGAAAGGGEEDTEKAEAVKRRKALLTQLAGGNAANAITSATEREAFLNEHLYRQCKALALITRHWTETQQQPEVQRLREELQRSREVLERTRTGPAPPTAEEVRAQEELAAQHEAAALRRRQQVAAATEGEDIGRHGRKKRKRDRDE